jgi:RimJ/RimL family protein N-acetyltransferase
VVLRDWRDDDAPALETVCGDPDVCHFTSVPWTYTLEGARQWIARQRETRRAGEVLALAVTRAGEEAAALGNVNLVRFGEDGSTATLGYWLVPGARRQGLAFPAARLLCDYGFAELGLKRIELAILPQNAASHRVAARLGAVREGPRRDIHRGREWELIVYSLTPADAR